MNRRELELDNRRLIKTASKQAGAIDNMTYTFKDICNKMTSAPSLELNRNNIRAIIYQNRTDDDFVDHILFQYKHDNFVKYLGDGIRVAFVTDDPEKQSIWSTDVTRLNFIIRSILRKKPIWLNDSKGEEIKEILINPLLDEIASIVNDYLKTAIIPKEGPWKDEFDRLLLANEFVNKLKSGDYSDPVSRYIAPFFKATKQRFLLD